MLTVQMKSILELLSGKDALLIKAIAYQVNSDVNFSTFKSRIQHIRVSLGQLEKLGLVERRKDTLNQFHWYLTEAGNSEVASRLTSHE